MLTQLPGSKLAGEKETDYNWGGVDTGWGILLRKALLDIKIKQNMKGSH